MQEHMLFFTYLQAENNFSVSIPYKNSQETSTYNTICMLTILINDEPLTITCPSLKCSLKIVSDKNIIYLGVSVVDKIFTYSSNIDHFTSDPVPCQWPRKTSEDGPGFGILQPLWKIWMKLWILVAVQCSPGYGGHMGSEPLKEGITVYLSPFFSLS